MQNNPWGPDNLSGERAVLLALGAEPQPLSSIAKNAGVTEDTAAAALRSLTAQNLAIPDEGGYELTGPLSWFGGFASAIAHGVRKKFVVRVPGDPHTHAFVSEIRVKGTRRAGDPDNETLAVLACAKTAGEVAMAPSEAPTCADCAHVMGDN